MRTTLKRLGVALVLSLVLSVLADVGPEISSGVSAATGTPTLAVQVAYADGTRASSPKFPNPWFGSAGVKFLGCKPPSSCTYDGGAVRFVNTSSRFLEIIRTVVVHIGSCTYTWSPYATSAAELEPGESLILTQFSSGSPFLGGCTGPTPNYFDGSDIGPNDSSYTGKCTPDHITPTVDVTMGSRRTTTYTDFGQVLNTGGYDVAGCPLGTNESIPWTALNGIDKIQHTIVVIQENHSADNYFGQFYKQGQAGYVAEPSKGNPNPLGGGAIVPFPNVNVCETGDTNHSWNGAHQEWNGGAMNGFTRANSINVIQNPPDPDPNPVDLMDPSGSRAMGNYNLPFYNNLYSTFATGDHFFSSLLAGTQPNRFYLYAATSFGWIRNLTPTESAAHLVPGQGFTQQTIFRKLTNAGISWRYYYGGNAAPFVPGTAAVLFNDVSFADTAPISQYYTDLQNNALPQVSFVDPTFTDSKPSLVTNNAPNLATDEHPPSNVQVGQTYIHSLIKALGQSTAWATSALFLTYDESGGYYDHVRPPNAVPPDSITPMLKTPSFLSPSADVPGTFNRYGFRVPILVVSPFAKSHYVSHRMNDQTSILRFIEERYNLGTLTARDAAANPMFEFFNFASPSFPQMPASILGPAPKVIPCAVLNDLSYGQTLSGNPFSSNLSAKAWAGDPSLPLNVTKVEFHLSGGATNGVIATVNSPNFITGNWNASWNTTSVPNGTYTLWAVAFDSAGNSGQSAPIQIKVKN